MKKRIVLALFALVLLVLGLSLTGSELTGWFLCGYFVLIGLARVGYVLGFKDLLKNRFNFDFSIDNSKWLSSSLKKNL